MAIEPVKEPAAPLQRKIFPDRQRLDFADAARSRLPDVAGWIAWLRRQIVGRHRQDADRSAHPLMGELAPQERSVPAIVLDHEQANEQPAGERRQRERDPDKAMARGEGHCGPERGEGRKGDRELKHRARCVRPAVRRERLRPIARPGPRLFFP